MGKRKKRPQPQAIYHGGDTFDLCLVRLVKCDDGVVRLEIVPDDHSKLRLSEDVRRNIFVTGYLHDALPKLMAEAAEWEPE